jgi:replicative DNA helicase
MAWSKSLKENCQDIQRDVDIRQFLTKAKNAGYICPWCGSGSGKHGTGVKLYDTNTIHCYSCGRSADVLAVYQKAYGVTLQEALNALLDESTEYEKPKAPIKEQQPADDVPQQDFKPYYEQVRARIADTDYHRGITLDTLTRFWVGYDEAWTNPARPNTYPSKRLIIPIDSSHYLARSTGKSKWVKLYAGKGRVLFNYKALEKTTEQPIFVVEGELDAISIVDVGGQAVGLGGDTPKTLQDALQEHPPKVPLLIALDNDEEGRKHTQAFIDLCESLQVQYGIVDTSVLFLGCKDANDALQADREEFRKAVLAWQKIF